MAGWPLAMAGWPLAMAGTATASSGAAAVGADGQRREDHEDAKRPQQ